MDLLTVLNEAKFLSTTTTTSPNDRPFVMIGANAFAIQVPMYVFALSIPFSTCTSTIVFSHLSLPMSTYPLYKLLLLFCARIYLPILSFVYTCTYYRLTYTNYLPTHFSLFVDICIDCRSFLLYLHTNLFRYQPFIYTST